MKKEQLMNLGLTEEMAQKIIDINYEEMKTFIPKSRFDQVNEQKKELEKILFEKDILITEMSLNKIKNQELEKIIKDLLEANAVIKADQEDKLKNIIIQSAIRAKLVNVKYADLLITKFNISKLVLRSDGTVTGIEEQIEELREVYKDLF